MKGIYEHQNLSQNKGLRINEYIQDYFTSPLHYHESYELILIEKSRGKLFIENKIINFAPGDIFLIAPNLVHCFYNRHVIRKDEKKARAIAIFFMKTILGDTLLSNPLSSKINCLFENDLIYLTESKPYLKTFFKNISTAEGFEKIILFLQLLNRISKENYKLFKKNPSFNSGVNPFEDQRLKPVLEYIFKDFTNQLTLTKAASKAFMNKASFCRFFKQCTEKTFTEFVNEVRITHALSLLAEEEKSISDICYESGYQNISYFNRQFKNITGNTPSEYKKSIKIGGSFKGYLGE